MVSSLSILAPCSHNAVSQPAVNIYLEILGIPAAASALYMAINIPPKTLSVISFRIKIIGTALVLPLVLGAYNYVDSNR
jgi:hypothetical protein